MRRTMIIMIAIMFIMCMSACKIKDIEQNNNAPVTTPETGNEENLNISELPYEEGKWKNKDWDKIELPFEEICIPDKETAIQITSAFVKAFQHKKLFINYKPQSVFYDIEDEIWIVSFCEGDVPGASLTIAIRKDNAEVVKMWLGE